MENWSKTIRTTSRSRASYSLATSATKRFHIVVASDSGSERCTIIAVYWPDVLVWLDDWKRRR